MLDTESRHGSALDQGPSRDPWLTTMDWTLGTDQSLQDMLDCDIKSEIDSVIGGHPELGFNFTELSPLELDEDPAGCSSDLNGWFGSQSLLNGNSNSSNSNFNLDLTGTDAASLMVNPKSVMPHMSLRGPPRDAAGAVGGPGSGAPTDGKRHFAFPAGPPARGELAELAELPEQDGAGEPGAAEPESDAEHEDEAELAASESEEEDESEEEELQPPQPVKQHAGGQSIRLSLGPSKGKATLLLPAGTIKTLSPQFVKAQQQQHHHHHHHHHQHQQQQQQQQQQQPPQQTIKVNGIAGVRLQNLKILQNTGQMQQIRRQVCSSNGLSQVLAQQQQALQQQQQQLLQPQQQATQLSQVATSTTGGSCSKGDKEVDPLSPDYDVKPYPKPAYSYSCLIAMALKNSQTGSLPVSEIYNFMCEHFPYFKTAPNGWKNSVRHNLSLNKCFEKIEKPAGNGNQRKGCLWAINPAKIAKMDEEVQKWSRKDPLAIKKAMIYPDHLELLERGEMKYVGSSNGDLSEETESSADEAESPEEAVHPHSNGLAHGHLAANSVTDSYDESSQDCDVDVSEQLYDEIDIDENKDTLHMQLNISKQESTLSDYQLSAKRQKTLTGTLQANYVYQPVTTARRKTPLFLTTNAATGSFLKIE